MNQFSADAVKREGVCAAAAAQFKGESGEKEPRSVSFGGAAGD
ncbi:hypothetical protein [Paenibacillus allorhizoplanae]|nr:hypothetical protein [Paenibacillus allorhizoplanae]